MADQDSSPAARLRVSELIAAIGSERVSPGAGAAGAVTLALAAACAAKAAAVSLKRAGNDSELREALARFLQLADHALESADRDAETFEQFMQERTGAAADALIETGEHAAGLSHRLLTLLEAIQPRIDPVLQGDVAAARLLAHAARAIQRRNVAETEKSAP